MDIKTRPIYTLSTRDPLEAQGNIQTERVMEKIFHETEDQKNAAVAKLILDKIYFKINIITIDKKYTT